MALLLISVGTLASITYATHSWSNYHWSHDSNSLTLSIGDNVTSQWDERLAQASNDWSQSAILDANIVTGATNPKNCKAVAGRVEVCNSKYGNNGWLGIASIWVSGSHIAKGTVKLNDTYFNAAKYNTVAWRNMVVCQEVGHTFGLNHQDEDFNNLNLGTCMDYTNDPTGTAGTNGALNNEHPNTHDYDELALIYSHLDSATTAPASRGASAQTDVDTSNPSEWGKAIRKSSDGANSLYERDLGKGHKIFTFVIWAK